MYVLDGYRDTNPREKYTPLYSLGAITEYKNHLKYASNKIHFTVIYLRQEMC